MKVDEVGDQRHRQAVVGQGGAEQAGGALVEGAHGVAEVGHQSCAGVGGVGCQLGGARRVPQSDQDPGGAEACRRLERAGEFGGERQDPEDAAQPLEPADVDGAAQVSH